MWENKPTGPQILKLSYTDLKINMHSLFKEVKDKIESFGRDLKTAKRKRKKKEFYHVLLKTCADSLGLTRSRVFGHLFGFSCHGCKRF